MKMRLRRRGLLGIATLLLAATPATGAPLLDELAEDAALTAVARIAAISEHADGQLRVYGLEEVEILRGIAPASFALLEEGSAPRRLAEPGETVLLLLSRAPTHSFFRQHLPAGSYFVPVARPDGVIVIGPGQGELAREIARAKAPEWGQAAALALARRELRSGHERLALDGVRRLERLRGEGAALGREDLAAVRACLDDERIEVPVRSRLVALLTDAELAGARALLEAWQPRSAQLRGDRSEALYALGAPTEAGDPTGLLRHPDPDQRRLGVRQAALRPSPEVLRELGSLALGDPDPAVRVAAVEALGRTGRPEAAILLRQIFQVEEIALRTASARALKAMGAAEASAAFLDLVLYGEDYDVQRYALLLLFSEGLTRDDPRIERIEREHPDERIRQLVARGLQPASH